MRNHFSRNKSINDTAPTTLIIVYRGQMNIHFVHFNPHQILILAVVHLSQIRQISVFTHQLNIKMVEVCTHQKKQFVIIIMDIKKIKKR